jgi:integral membrane protein (TIGR00529 family)
MILNSSIALLISIGLILILVRTKLHVSFAVLCGCVILIIFTIPFKSVPALLLDSLLDKQTLTLLVVVPCTMVFAKLMEVKGLLTSLARVLEGIGPRIAVHAIPVFIGLVPMPAGALVAATAVNDISKKLNLRPEQVTFINYWFRHIWEFSLPIYSTVIITSSVLGIPMATLVKTLAPMSLLAIVLGLIVSYRMVKNRPPQNGRIKEPFKVVVYDFLKAAWPIVLLVVLIFSKVDALIAFPVTLILLMVQQRVKWSEMRKPLKYGLNPLILLLLLAIMLYKTTVENAGVAGNLVTDMQLIGLPPVLILAGLPFLMGLTLGYAPAMAGIALPLLASFIMDGAEIYSGSLIIAYTSGIVGQLLSPAHLCLILSTEYFKASLFKVYRYLLPLGLALEAIALGMYYVGF